MPLTNGNVTIKLAGGTYSTWAGFWTDLGNLTGDITCTVDASVFTETAGSGAVTETLGGHTLHVLPTSFPTKTDVSDGARFTFNTTDIPLYMQMEGAWELIIEGMALIEGTSKATRVFFLIGISTSFNLTFKRNIIKGGTDSIAHSDGTLNSGTKIYNNIIYGASSEGITIVYDIPDALIVNNTIVDSNYNVSCGDELVTLENNLSYGGGQRDFFNIEILTIGNNNADSDNTGEDADWGGGGANNVPGIGDPFNNLAADDFTITAEGVVGTAGKDLSGTFTDDFFGVTRVNWTIGACEFAAAGHEVMGVESVTEVMGVESVVEILGVTQ